MENYKRIKLWSDGDTQLLLDLCGSYLFQIGPMKKFKNKKEMWTKISTQIPDKSAKQCEERFKTVLRRKKTKTDPPVIPPTAKKLNLHNCMALVEPHVQIDFETFCNDNIKQEPEVHFEHNDEEEEMYRESCRSNHERPTLTVQETLWKLAEEHEVAHERRHKEQLKAMEKMTALLQQLLEEKGQRI